jgi:hypothetical protein
MKAPLIFFLIALVLTLLFAPVALSAQEQRDSQNISIKSKEISNGVVILSVQNSKSSFDLQCNKDFAGCAVLNPGDYVMVRLPKNRGLYDCVNAEVYGKTANAELGDRLGQYCLIEKK